MKPTLFLLMILFTFSSCKAPSKITSAKTSGQFVLNGKLWSSAFQQRAAEYKALCLQAYNIARLRIDEALKIPLGKPLAIISDIDETILDNSPYAVHQSLAGKDFEAQSWQEWTAKGIADTLAGSYSFFKYAASRNIEIFYITNRDEKDKAGTLLNLQRYGFPFADKDHVVVRSTSSGKEERIQAVAASYNIILLLGDNLADFSSLFDKKTELERDKNVKVLAVAFGNKFIVLPNSNYGGWEDAMYNNTRNWTAFQKDSLVKSGLKGY